jgi:predicted DsbA family dithiol-disulfide isomerase
MDKENIEPLANEEIQAKNMGINSVPTFIVKQHIVINGAQSVDNFELIFTKLLSKVH